MKIFSVLFLFAVFIACSQRQETKKHIPDPKAERLFDSAKLARYNLKYDDAIHLLEQATQIDSNYYGAYNLKLSCQRTLGRFNDALITSKNMVRIGSNNPDTYTTYGILLDSIAGDSIIARDFYKKAIKKIDQLLDTMNKSSYNYEFLLTSKGVNLALMGESEKANKIWKNQQRTQIYSNQMGKSRKQLLDMFFWGDTTSNKTNLNAPVEIRSNQ